MLRSSRPLLAASAAAALLTLAACGGSGAGSSAPADTLRIAGPFEVHSLDPTADGEVFTRLQVSETLVTADLQGELVPGLATSWSTSEDGRTWRFELVEGATFHDGTPLDAEAAVGALERVAAVEASPLSGAPIRALRAEGSTVVVELDEPHPVLPALLTHYSAAVLAPASYDESGQVAEVIGTGPYRVADVELPASVETERFAGYRGEAPEVERVTFQAVGRAEQRALLASSGQADVVFGLEPAGQQRVESSDVADLASSLQPRTIRLKVDAEHPVLGDVRVRRALSLALDREAMAEAVLREGDLAATQLLPPSLEAWQADVEPLVHDQQAAAALLDEAGWVTGPDGTRVRDGEPLSLTLLTYPDRAELPALATAIQAALAEVGVDLEVEVTNSSEVPAGQADGSLEMALIAKHFALVSDPLVDVATVFDPAGSDWGVMGWSDPAVTAAVDDLLAGATGAAAQQARETVARTAQQELPLIPVAWYRMNAAVNDRVEGFTMDPLETTWRLTDLRWGA
ncbi:ABC transporter substrate-binding protein [Nocardioides perillae]|uniref:Peptide/nickel transport system substrate-binding protein n=1 Tax=Nocardioides perillae TaxID=1119534 RepID=A0A7Y9RSV1_9ACTN|nr:peptide/nickel transport system substrate-binding protein [Nocardioides perillae]